MSGNPGDEGGPFRSLRSRKVSLTPAQPSPSQTSKARKGKGKKRAAGSESPESKAPIAKRTKGKTIELPLEDNRDFQDEPEDHLSDHGSQSSQRQPEEPDSEQRQPEDSQAWKPRRRLVGATVG
jgi:hypothetical protein